MNDTTQTTRRISAAEKITDSLGADVGEVIAGKPQFALAAPSQEKEGK